ncbi:MAG: FHA domain-containing protein [Planctomycetia bacterium]
MSHEATSEQTGPAAAPAAALELRIAGRAGPTFALDPACDNTLGRAQDASVVLADRLASRIHAAVRFEDGRWMIRDLGSRNGTWVDGAQIAAQPLTDGAVIRIGTAELAFRITRPAPSSRSTAGGEPQLVKCGPVAQLEGSVLRRSSIGSSDDARRPLLLYQASIRLLSSRSTRETIGATLELAAEHCGAASVGWFNVRAEDRLEPVCGVPPGSPLARLRGESTCRLVAREGNAVWTAPAGDADAVEIACVPIVEKGLVHAALAASAPKGALRSADFDFLVALASLAAAACAGHTQGTALMGAASADLASLQTIDLDAIDEDAADADHTIALDPGSLDIGSLDLGNLERIILTTADESPAAARIGSFVAETATLKLGDWQRVLVIEALRRTGGSVFNAAAELGISRATLCRKLEAYGLTKSRP